MAAKKTIVVLGDVTLDWLQEEIPRSQAGDSKRLRNYQFHAGFRWTPVWGGAALVERLLKSAIEARHGAGAPFRFDGVEARLPKTMKDETIDYLQSLAIVKQMVKDEDKPLRVDSFRGFTADPKKRTAVAPYPTSVPPGACIVVDDAANGCRDDPEFVRNLTQLSAKASLIVIKLSRPLESSVLMKALIKPGSTPGPRTVVVVNADDLRAQGLDISRRLSWERSAIDLLRAANDSSILKKLTGVGDVLVRFANDGCIVLQHNHARYLVFDPRRAEDTYDQELSGTMPGATSAFTADVTAALLKSADSLRHAVPLALCASRRLLRRGFDQHKTTQRPIDYPLRVFRSRDAPDVKNDFKIVNLPVGDESQEDWSILSTRLPKRSLDLARKIVQEGHEKHLKNVPVAQFGKLLLIDKGEIEGYRSIENLFREYIKGRHGARPRPLSIGVFGPPGSGKSFGIKEIAAGIRETEIKVLPFNLTQFEGPADLNSAFHIARDESLKGKLPLLIFDEFDCPFGQQPWGWLKFFLAPMQDGEFNDNGQIHPLGHAIFLFAGGIAHTFKKFTEPSVTHNLKPPTESDSEARFKEAKGPDFASRLKGYVDVVGVNPPSTEGRKDSELVNVEVNSVYIVRRAILLRSLLLEQEHRTRNMNPITDGKNRFDIDRAVLNALLRVKRYRHGARSLESILTMSRLTDRDHFGVASLPSEAQLTIHVDKSFVNILKEPPEDS